MGLLEASAASIMQPTKLCRVRETKERMVIWTKSLETETMTLESIKQMQVCCTVKYSFCGVCNHIALPPLQASLKDRPDDVSALVCSLTSIAACVQADIQKLRNLNLTGRNMLAIFYERRHMHEQQVAGAHTSTAADGQGEEVGVRKLQYARACIRRSR